MHCLSRTPRSYLLNSYSDVKESDEIRREWYEASWLDLVMETRPEYRNTLTEKDSSRKESYERKQVVHFVVRRFPNQTLCIGQDGMKMREYHLPYKNVLPIPIFVPRDVTALREANQEPPASHLQSIMDVEKSWNENKEPECEVKGKPRVIEPNKEEFRMSGLFLPPRDSAQRS
ncbi:telethonin [Astyanax mexicanus]|uniref:Telethonin-like n=2 Tax=Astyanax mexicanus TaxID=7994 RepID=A0A8B9LCJ2_ASTMX|nr:telethonin [Astyanax mexicanus]KAG9283653.1 telethonin-like [Astyanax mexicanus]